MYGKKADNLLILQKGGINVPAFTVVSSESPDKYELPSDSGLYSVRSSCNLEDGALSSFAGQFDTYLNVRMEEVNDRIKMAFDSVKNESVISYAKHNDIPLTDIRMNVIIQDMISSDLSGVIFTSNPQGILNETVITVGRGLGEDVVQSRTDTTSYYYNCTDKVFFYEGSEDLLTLSEVERLIDISARINELLGEYLDIEFAIKDGEIYILQAREITTLNTSDPLILDNSNIVESYPNLSLPLTCSFVDMVYGGVFRGLSARVLKNDKELSRHEDVFMNMTGHVNGRVYYKISNWYTVLKFLPFNRKIIPVWQEMMGVRNKVYDKDDVKLTPFVRMMTYINSFTELISVPKNMRKLNDTFTAINDDFYKRYSENLTAEEVMDLYDEIKVKLFGCWDVTLLNDMYAFIFTGLLKSRLKKRYKRSDKEINSYISGISDIESMKPVIAITKLALDKDTLPENDYEAARAEYIRLYGDRNLEELKLESRTFRSDPALLDERIESYRKDMKRLRENYAGFSSPKEEETKTDPVTRMYIRRCSLGIFNREVSRLNRSRIYGMVRLIFDHLGKIYSDEGLIGDPFDIYWLTTDEATALYKTKEIMTGTVADRKKKYELFRELPAYSRLIFAGDEFDRTNMTVNSYRREISDTDIAGTPCSGGTVEGEVLVIRSIEDTYDVKDKILVTKMTDPGWVFLLTSAKGVISEKGSLLSHTAIISRELKIPSIVGIKGITEMLKTGDTVRMDGDTGEVTIVKRKEA
ncbi:MAG: phosphoenolpyruvate synthase [Clostridiales bacterium]|nr:phosphoenolpyruvate synthase [Clostridiales bacterium]